MPSPVSRTGRSRRCQAALHRGMMAGISIVATPLSRRYKAPPFIEARKAGDSRRTRTRTRRSKAPLSIEECSMTYSRSCQRTSLLEGAALHRGGIRETGFVNNTAALQGAAFIEAPRGLRGRVACRRVAALQSAALHRGCKFAALDIVAEEVAALQSAALNRAGSQWSRPIPTAGGRCGCETPPFTEATSTPGVSVTGGRRAPERGSRHCMSSAALHRGRAVPFVSVASMDESRRWRAPPFIEDRTRRTSTAGAAHVGPVGRGSRRCKRRPSSTL